MRPTKISIKKRRFIFSAIKSFFWFAVGASLGLFLFVSFVFIYFKQNYTYVVYPGVTVNGVQFGGKTREEVKAYFDSKNASFAETMFIFDVKDNDEDIIIRAKDIGYGYDSQLLADQAYSIGRSPDSFSNLTLVFQAYLNGVYLSPSYRYSEEKLAFLLSPVIEKERKAPIDALFRFENGRVATFRPSNDGQEVDLEKLKDDLESNREIIINNKTKEITFEIPIKILKPAITTESVNNLGIKELIASGTSSFAGSIPNRIYNITLAAGKMDGVLVPPNEVFSFNKVLGDVSALTGFKQAYVIESGKTVLGDGGGVCQVSTTFFRAILNAGLPIVERHAHAYRVSYYEQDMQPGFDAAIYTPNIDLRFKNDTGNHILVQSVVDQENQRITFFLYGTRDGREVELSKATITSQTPSPEPLYQDDPTLPKGTIKQIDFAAAGATVYFTRTVKKDGKILSFTKFSSNYRPWQAIYLRGTQ